MPTSQSGASARPRKNSPKSKKAPKSHKADGTPKKRWSAAERAERGLGPRRSGGQRAERPRDDRPARAGDRTERTGRPDRIERRDDRPARSFDRSDRPARSFDRTDRPARSFDRTDRPARSFDRSDRPARSDRPERTYDRSDRPARTDRPARSYDRTERPERSYQRRDDRPTRRYETPDRHDAPTESDQMSWTPTEAPVAAAAPAGRSGFADLGVPAALTDALAAQGITDPFPIQASTIPDALSGRDVLGRGRTGSGKTLGFGLPMLARLSGRRGTTPRGLVLVPTRELALQVADVLAPLARTLDLSVTLVAGGMAYGPQLKALSRGVDVVVATPGRLIDLMDQGAADLTAVEVTVLDEADHMADLGFLPAVTTIMNTVPADGQRLLFSATLDRGIDRIVRTYLHDPVTHEVDEATASVTTMEHHVLHVQPADKSRLTAEIAGRPGRTVVFVRTQRGADRVADQLREAGVMAGALHGGLTQGARARTLDAFKDGRVGVLVATDVAARGIHVDDVSLVLQADPPAGPKEYLHRAGRTARAGDTGVVVTFALPHQQRELKKLTRDAGVKANPIDARPGDPALSEATGSVVPSGTAIATADYQRLIAPAAPQRANRRPGGRRDHNRRPGRRFDRRS